MIMSTYFGFIDDVGNPSDKNQRFYGTGLLTLENPTKLHEIISKRLRIGGYGRQEIKFQNITHSSHSMYRIIIKELSIYFKTNQAGFSCIIVDSWARSEKSTQYEQYIKLSEQLISESKIDRFTILADAMTAPAHEDIKFTDALEKIDSVQNAMMLDSRSTLSLQLVDVLLGCVIAGIAWENGLKYKNIHKHMVSNQLKNEINLESYTHGKTNLPFSIKFLVGG